MAKKPLKITEDQNLYVKKVEGIYPIRESDWTGIKKMVSEIKCPNKGYELGASFCAGLSGSAFLAVLGIWNTEVSNGWIKLALIGIAIFSLILAIILYIVSKDQIENNAQMGKDIIDEMNNIEKQYDKGCHIDGSNDAPNTTSAF